LILVGKGPSVRGAAAIDDIPELENGPRVLAIAPGGVAAQADEWRHLQGGAGEHALGNEDGAFGVRGLIEGFLDGGGVIGLAVTHGIEVAHVQQVGPDAGGADNPRGRGLDEVSSGYRRGHALPFCPIVPHLKV